MNHLIEETALRLQSWLPQHKGGLFISHNEHKNYYEKLIDYLSSDGADGNWATHMAMIRAIDTDELWELQWYPDTPVGFNRIFAPTLAELIDFAEHCRNYPALNA